MIRTTINKFLGTAAITELVGKNETFRHKPGRLSIDLLITPQREQAFMQRRNLIEGDRASKAAAAMKSFSKVMSDAKAARDSAIEEAEQTYKRDLRALFVDFNQVVDESAPLPGTAVPTPANGRRRIQTPRDAELEIPNRVAEVVAERQT